MRKKPISTCLTLSVTAFVLIGGCDDGGGSDCVTQSDCVSGQVCLNGTCQPVDVNDSGTDADADVDTNEGDGSNDCPEERVCEDLCCSAAEVCGGGRCCAPEVVCGGACCTDVETCVAESCVLACEGESVACVAEDGSERCCEGGNVCYLGDCVTPGDECMTSIDCPSESYCELTIERCLPQAELEECEYRPEVAPFEMVEEWHWSGDEEVLPEFDQVMMTPIVANLTDDDGNGLIDANDIPDVIFTNFTGSGYVNPGVMRAISGDSGSRIWPIGDPGYRVAPNRQLAIAELVATSPGPEIVACLSNGADGWEIGIVAASGSLLPFLEVGEPPISCPSNPIVADMDSDGVPEIVAGNAVIQADGTVVGRDIVGGARAVADIDDDGDMEIVTANSAHEMNGDVIWSRAVDSELGMALPSGHVAVADLDLDGSPELVATYASLHSIIALDAATGIDFWPELIDINPLHDPIVAAAVEADTSQGRGGGPVTIANFDDDEYPEIAFAGGFAYVIFENDGALKWYHVTQDRSSRATGSSIFDFEGDGVAEVLYNDELLFRVLRGNDGFVLLERCNTSGTLQEYPLVVDVDNDNNAEIVLMENNYAFSSCADGSPSTTGIHVFGHPTGQWVRTRRIWNQHTYHVTNVEEDGTIPLHERNNWEVDGLNNFRQNVQPDGLFNAPDLVLRDLAASTRACPEVIGLSVRVVNLGRSGAIAGIPVTFYDVSEGSRVRIGTTWTPEPLLPGQSVVVELDGGFAVPEERRDQVIQFEAVINDPDDDPVITLNECRTENNGAGPIEAACPVIY